MLEATQQLQKAGFDGHRVMIDLSHANSKKDYRRQPEVAEDVARQIEQGNFDIMGVMIESHLVEGRQDKPETYGQSITDACIGWDSTESVLSHLAQAVQKRNAVQQ